MRRFLALMTALGMISLYPSGGAESPPEATAPGYTLRTSSEEQLVFAARNLKANLVGTIQPGTEQDVELLSVDGDWCFIRFQAADGERCGFVPLSCFDMAPQATPTPAPTVSIAAGTPAWVANASTGYRLNLREEPRAMAASLGKYYTGTPVTLTGVTENGFAQVLLAGTALGWMDLQYLTTDAAAFVPEMPVVTAKGSAVLRKGPGTDHARISRHDSGTTITVLGVRSDGWYHVQIGDQTGYIAESTLSGNFPFGYGMDSDNPSVSESNTDQESVFYINTRSSGSQLHLRKAASASARSMGLFYTGTPISVISYTRTGWAYVRIGQTEGYMAADYFTETKPQQYGETRILRNAHANGLNLRDTPSTGGTLLDYIPNGDEIILLGTLSNDWCYVDYHGTLGYIYNDGSLKTK